MTSQTCLQAQALWGVVVFILNGLLGLELKPILATLADRPPLELARDGTIVSLTVMAVRLVWVFPGTYLPRFLSQLVRARDPYPPWQSTVIVGWTGMRGATSLASALAIPLAFRTHTNGPGVAFPDRDLIIFLAFSVILSTLVLQGLTLLPLIRRLRLPDDTGAEHEESKARLLATRAAMARIDELARRRTWSTTCARTTRTTTAASPRASRAQTKTGRRTRGAPRPTGACARSCSRSSAAPWSTCATGA